MKKALFTLLTLVLFAKVGITQVYDGDPQDSIIVRFSNGMPNYVADTATSPVWQIGVTHKAFFASGSSGTRAMMTDTLNPYPVSANNFFVLKIHNGTNTIVDFWHKYQTDSAHDGGTVEFSNDNGATWQNIIGACTSNGSTCMPGVKTTNFYSPTDTLADGTPAFSGTHDSVIYSRFQFFRGCPVHPTSTCSLYADTFYVRFRFESDTTSDTLAGWRIDSIKIENDMYPGAVPIVNKYNQLLVIPNPTTDFTFQFPGLENEEDYTIEVFNAIGEKIVSKPYSKKLNLNYQPVGIYYYKVTNGKDYYSGQLQVE